MLRLAFLPLLTAGYLVASACSPPSSIDISSLPDAPPHAVPIMPRLPLGMRVSVFSRDRRHIAYTTDAPGPSELWVATFGGEVRQLVPRLEDDVTNLQFGGGPEGLMFARPTYKEVPGEYDDWNVPHRDHVGDKVFRGTVEGQASEVITFPPGVQFQASASRPEIYFRERKGLGKDPTVEFHSLDLATREERILFALKDAGPFYLRPNGHEAIVIGTNWPSTSGSVSVRLVDLETMAVTVVVKRVSSQVRLSEDGNVLVEFKAIKGSRRILAWSRGAIQGEDTRLRRVTVQHDLPYHRFQIGELSPDGQWAAASFDGRLVVLDLETGRILDAGPQAHVTGWLDARRMMVRYRTGHHALDISDLPLLAPPPSPEPTPQPRPASSGRGSAVQGSPRPGSSFSPWDPFLFPGPMPSR